MNRVQVLDCTLRDGGYCNQWKFGADNIVKITQSLVDAHVDIIECGFITNKTIYQCDISKFNTIEQIGQIIPKVRSGKLFVAMANYGEIEIADLPVYDGTSIDGIRVAFHKKNMVESLDLCRKIKEKGYKVFIQAMLSLNYTDEEFLDLIKRANAFEPYAFYIVDSFGVMKLKDLIRLFYMVEHNLCENIIIGYHSHNNLQLAYSNAQALVETHTNRALIIDASIMGMGRGAGNLNTELFTEYLNDNLSTQYVLKPLLQIIDEVLNQFYQQNYWGYSLTNYLSAKHNSHPDYATYLDEKKTLTVENIDEIFHIMEDEKRANYDKKYIEELYIAYMGNGKIYEDHLSELKRHIVGKKVLLIAPGKSVYDEQEKVAVCASEPNIITISVNFDYKGLSTDYIFLSNLRRYRELDKRKRAKTIVTSNIPAEGVYLQTKYAELINDIESVKDNAGMMLIQYLINLGVKEVFLAGVDGYSRDSVINYAEKNMNFKTRIAVSDALNSGISDMLKKFSKDITIKFITTPKFVII